MAGIGKYEKGKKFTLKSGNTPLFKQMGSSSTPLYRVKQGKDDLFEQERVIRDKMQRDAAKQELKAMKKQRRADKLEDKGRGRRAYRKAKKAEGLMESADKTRYREQEMYKKGLASAYGSTPEEIAADIAFEYDPEGRRYGSTKGTRFLGKARGRKDVSRVTFDEAAHQEAYDKFEEDNPVAKKEKTPSGKTKLKQTKRSEKWVYKKTSTNPKKYKTKVKFKKKGGQTVRVTKTRAGTFGKKTKQID